VTAPFNSSAGDPRCLNCGEALSGAFCAACGQRSVPADPTVTELAGDAWHELSGYDGRIASTFRGLLHPGKLTVEYLQGRRATYLPPVRLYLVASVLYFVIAAAAPESARQPGQVLGPGGLQIGLTDTEGRTLSPEDREALRKDVEGAPWVVRPMLRAIVEDPREFRARLFTIMPRVFFGMLPVFAGILALVYSGRRFPTALVFAAHVHAAAFLLFALAAAARLTGSPIIEAAVGVTAIAVFGGYVLLALRAVFGGSWPKTIVKAAAIGILYLICAVPAFMVILIWASLV